MSLKLVDGLGKPSSHIRFNSGKYDLNLAKEYFIRTLSDMSSVNVMKKDNTYVFLSTPRFRFLDVRNYLALGLNLCKANGCAMEKLILPYERLDNYGKLTHVRPVAYKAFYSGLKNGPTITCDEYDKFVQEFSKWDCMIMMDWLRVYNLNDIILFIESL